MASQAAGAYRDEVLKSLEKALRKQSDHQERMLEILQESHLTQQELVKVLKDLKRVMSIKGPDPVQLEMLAVLKEIRDELKSR